MSEFVLMLTLDDETVPDALETYEAIADTGITCIGFKDIGIPEADQQSLVDAIRSNGHTSFLEVVDLTEDGERRSAEAAVRMNVDYLVGGTRIEPTMSVLDGSSVRYMPYVGEVVGHPAVLQGTPDSIVTSARAAIERGAHGINLLAYRYTGDGHALAREVVAAVDAPVLSAGSIDSLARVEEICRAGVWGFTIGGAVITKTIVRGSLPEQIRAVLDRVERLRASTETNEEAHP